MSYLETSAPNITIILLQILYTIRSERQLMEQLDYNLLFRWFVGLNMDEPVWDPTVRAPSSPRAKARCVGDHPVTVVYRRESA